MSGSANCSIDLNPTSISSNIVITVLILVLLVIGVIGTSITLCVIVKNKNLHTAFNLFLASLCVSDLTSALLCSPLWLYRRTWGFENWEWGKFLCKFYWVTDFATNYATALHILSLAAIRYYVIRNPLAIMRIRKKYIAIYVAILWPISIMLALPLLFYMGVRDRSTTNTQWPSCSIFNDKIEQYHLYSTIVYPIFFYLPEGLVIVFSVMISKQLLIKKRIIHKHTSCGSPRVDRETTASTNISIYSIRVRTETEGGFDSISETGRIDSPRTPRPNRVVERPKTNSKLHRACTQLTFISACFAFGYIPLTAYLLWSSAAHMPQTCECATCNVETDYWFGVISYITLRISECLNPVMYNIGCRDMRKASLEFIKKTLLKPFTFCCER